MGTVRRGFEEPFNRKLENEEKRHREEMRRMFPGAPEMAEPPKPPLPDATSRASRPDLYPAFAQGVGSATKPRVRHYDRYPAGNNIDDTNVQSDSRVATSGLADPNTAPAPLDRHGRATRPRKK